MVTADELRMCAEDISDDELREWLAVCAAEAARRGARLFVVEVPQDAYDELRRQATEDKIPIGRVASEYLVCSCGCIRNTCYCENDD